MILEENFEGENAIDAMIAMLVHTMRDPGKRKRIKRIIFSVNGSDVQMFVRAHEGALEVPESDSDCPLEELTDLTDDGHPTP